MNILVLAAHPDDESIGMGGTIKKLSKKNNIHLCVLTEGVSAQYNDKKMILERKNECKKSGKILGIKSYTFVDFPDMKLDSIHHLEINKELEKIISKFKPKIVYSPPSHDLNNDHRLVFDSALVAARPFSSSVKQLLSYECPGPVKQPFRPTVYQKVMKLVNKQVFFNL